MPVISSTCRLFSSLSSMVISSPRSFIRANEVSGFPASSGAARLLYRSVGAPPAPEGGSGAALPHEAGRLEPLAPSPARLVSPAQSFSLLCGSMGPRRFQRVSRIRRMFITPPLYICLGTPRRPINLMVDRRAAQGSGSPPGDMVMAGGGRRLDQARQDRQVVEVHIEGGHCQNCRLNADRQITDGNSPRVGGRPPGGEGGVGRDIIGSRLPAPPLEGAGGKVRVASLAMGPAVVATVAQQDKAGVVGVQPV